jgi:hypothetical protein
MRLRLSLNTAVVVLGILSFVSLAGYFLALHDIWHDYASPEVWTRAGQVLPDWYSPVNRCPGEWAMCTVGFLLMLAFHAALFARRLLRTSEATRK